MQLCPKSQINKTKEKTRKYVYKFSQSSVHTVVFEREQIPAELQMEHFNRRKEAVLAATKHTRSGMFKWSHPTSF